MKKPKEIYETDLAALVLSAQKGDSRACARLIETTQGKLTRFAMYLCGSRSEAEDLCQATYLKALESIRDLKDPSSFNSWIFRTLKNLFLDSRKGAQAQNVAWDESHGTSSTTEELSERNLHIRQALARMEPEDRILVLLVDLEEHSYSEAAQIVGISEANLKFKLHHARKIFMEFYQK